MTILKMAKWLYTAVVVYVCLSDVHLSTTALFGACLPIKLLISTCP